MRKFLFLLVALLLLTGCSKNTIEPTEPTGVEATDAPIVINEETLVDAIRLEILLSSDADQAQYLTLLEQSASYQVTEFTQSDTIITAQVRITTPDMYTIAKEVEKEPVSSVEELESLICEKIASAQTVTKQVELTFMPDGDSWIPVFSEAFLDALYGGLLTYRNEYLTQEAQ